MVSGDSGRLPVTSVTHSELTRAEVTSLEALDPAVMADQVLDALFDDLEQILEDPFPSGSRVYPYSTTRISSPRRFNRIWALGLVSAGVTVALSGLVLLVGGSLSQWVSRWASAGLDSSEMAAPVTYEAVSRVTVPAVIPSPTVVPESTTDPDPTPTPLVTRSAQPVARVAPPPSTPTPAMTLVGILQEPGPPAALIRVNGVVQQVALGRPVEGNWKVVTIAPHGVGVSNGYQNLMLQL